MSGTQSFPPIHEELSERLAKSGSQILRGELQRALELTEESHANLQALRQQLPGLLAGVGGPAPQEAEILESAARAIASSRPLEAHLQERLQDLERRSAEKAAEGDGSGPGELSAEDRAQLSPEIRELLEATEIQEDPAEIRRQLDQIEQNNRNIAQTAVDAARLAASTGSLGKIVFATANLWLSHTLASQIYDNEDTDFETSIRRQQLSETVTWGLGQVSNLLPVAGVVVGTLDFVKKLSGLRRGLWAGADKTLKFLEMYQTALGAWNEVFRSHQESLAGLDLLNET